MARAAYSGSACIERTRLGRCGRTPAPSYNHLTAQVSVRPFAAYPGVELAVVGQNLSDDVQRNAAALNKDEVVLPGCNMRVVLRLATF